MYYRWTYDRIASNPKLYGGDKGNPAIMNRYIQEFYGHLAVIQLDFRSMSQLASVSRARNKILEKNPQFDFRPKRDKKEA